MKSTLSAMLLVLATVLSACGSSPDAPACPGCPLTTTVSPTTRPATPTPTPTPTPTITTTPATPVPYPTPTPMACVGTPTACSSFDQTGCAKAVGCAYQTAGCAPYICTDLMDHLSCARANCLWNLVCTGTPASCYTMTNSVACGRQAGCTWQNNTCIGAAYTCQAMEADVATCNGQTGCGVASSPCNPITAVQASCNQISNTTQCAATNGCFWATAQCAGTPTPCENFSDASFCTANAGCSWEPIH